MESLSFSLYFSFYNIFSDTATLEKAVSTTPYKKLDWISFSLHAIIFLHAQNHCDPAIPTGYICDQRILQSNWLKVFLAITQEQELPEILHLYTKIEDKMFENKGSFLGHFRPYFVVFAQREFFLKDPAKYNCSGSPAFKCRRYRVDWPSIQNLFHHYKYAIIIQWICSGAIQ